MSYVKSVLQPNEQIVIEIARVYHATRRWPERL
jgi:hypothetical protein